MSHAAAAGRVLVALLILGALCTSAVDAAQEGLLAQHVSYFTNQSNLLFVLVTAAGVGGLSAAAPGRARFADVRGAAAFYLAMTGIIYALLVAPLDELLRWDIGWTGIVLHRLAPMVAVADWLLTPRRSTSGAGRILWWQLYPVCFLAFTWIRGASTGWYPYDFLDPTASSWAQVLVTTLIVLLAFLTVAAAVHRGEGLLSRGVARGPVSRGRRRSAPRAG